MGLSRERILLLVLLAAAIAVWWVAWPAATGGVLITVLDVGQGDCILVQAPSGRTMLVDGGGRPGQGSGGYEVGSETVVPALLARRVKRIDVLVMTHPHEDHIGGLGAVLEGVPVGMVLDPELESESETYRELRERIEERRIPVHRATEGQQINLGGGVRVEVLNPPEPRLTATGDEVNDNSVVLRLSDGPLSALLAGDIERRGAQRIARLGESVRSTVMKMPHHGSEGAASGGLVEAVRPEVGIISVGERNPFGHPAEETLRELRRVGAKVMRTDREGAVTVKLQPPRWWAWGHGWRGRRGEMIAGRAAGPEVRQME